VLRVKVKPLVWLPPQHGIPIHDDAVWSILSFTKAHTHDSTLWTGAVRTSLAPLSTDDGTLLRTLLFPRRRSEVCPSSSRRPGNDDCPSILGGTPGSNRFARRSQPSAPCQAFRGQLVPQDPSDEFRRRLIRSAWHRFRPIVSVNERPHRIWPAE